MKNLMAWAVAGEGAFLNAKPVRLHQHTSVKTVLCSSNSIDRPPYRKLLRIIDPRQELQVAAMESAVVKALSLLAGSGEIYPVLPISDETPSAPKFWDIAAADIVLKEAGARVTTFWGEAYTYDLPDVRCVHGVLMGTAAGHRYAMAQLQAAGYLEKRA
jgi:3'-phosphoadenosine 5'-phosphosulfate (PAPS) 3'-phosphatase